MSPQPSFETQGHRSAFESRRANWSFSWSFILISTNERVLKEFFLIGAATLTPQGAFCHSYFPLAVSCAHGDLDFLNAMGPLRSLEPSNVQSSTAWLDDMIGTRLSPMSPFADVGKLCMCCLAMPLWHTLSSFQSPVECLDCLGICISSNIWVRHGETW